jgi:hypothetical protein
VEQTASSLSCEELATFLRQRVALEHLLPVARQRVESGADDDTTIFDGELKAAIADASRVSG